MTRQNWGYAEATIRRLMSHMIRTPLATKIKWIGKGGKITFSFIKLKIKLKKVWRERRQRRPNEAR